MKKIILTAAFFMVTFALMAQTPYGNVTQRNYNIKTGFGIAFLSTESMWGYSLNSEYNHFVNKNLSLFSGVGVMHFREDTPELLKNAQVEMLELGINAHFLQNESLSFHIGGGGNLRYFHWGLATSPTRTHEFDGTIVPMGDKRTVNQFTAGYSLNAGFGLMLNDNMRLLFQEHLQNGSKQNLTWDSRILLMIKI